MGEHLGLNIGVAQYTINNSSHTFYVAGFSSFYGLLHYNIKYAPESKVWMNAIEVRVF